MLKVTLVKSPISSLKDQQDTVTALAFAARSSRSSTL